MTVIADLTIPADAFALGRFFEEFPNVEITLERVVPLQDEITPLFWISNGDRKAIEATLREQPEVETVEPLVTGENRSLFEIAFDGKLGGLVRTLVKTRATVLEATGSEEMWEFRLRFRSHDDLSSFNVALTDEGIPVTLRHLYNPTPPEDSQLLSPKQHQTLLLAYQEGYFEVPRRTSLTQLAEEVEISDSALSQRVRRGVAKLIEQTLLDERLSE